MRPSLPLIVLFLSALASPSTEADGDPRHLDQGFPLPSEGYADQPYIVVTRAGHWLCVMTTGRGEEGQPGQHIVSTISTDRGRSWSPLVPIEPADGPEASWAVPVITPSGRIYVFYTYNGDRVRTLRQRPIRTDMLGWYCFKFSDDHGRSWSAERHRLPVRLTACDRTNDWRGEVQIFWGIDKPKVDGTTVLFGFTKLGRYMLDDGEGWFVRSENLLHEPDPTRLQWDVLPTGDHGVRDAAFGSVQEEFNTVPLGQDRWYCVYRTTNGFPCEAYSADGGRTWTRPEPVRYHPGGRILRHPRACPKLFRTRDGRYLLWFHHHGGRSFADRNPAWITGGVERHGRIHWSEPEILLYADDPATRMSYPDLIEDGRRFWISETQKSVARVHPVDRDLLEALWRQVSDPPARVARRGRRVQAAGPELQHLRMPRLEHQTSPRGEPRGFTVETRVTFQSPSPGQTILDARLPGGRGVALQTTDRAAVKLVLNDGSVEVSWDCDPGTLIPGRTHQIAAVVDGGPRLITFVIDGVVQDGGGQRTFGWGRFPPGLGNLNGAGRATVGRGLEGTVRRVRLYDRPLRHAELVANHRAERGEH